jgi:nucleotide-binding universal stress UspA family protein
MMKSLVQLKNLGADLIIMGSHGRTGLKIYLR